MWNKIYRNTQTQDEDAILQSGEGIKPDSLDKDIAIGGDKFTKISDLLDAIGVKNRLSTYGIGRGPAMNAKIEALVAECTRFQADFWTRQGRKLTSSANKIDFLTAKQETCEKIDTEVRRLIAANQESIRMFNNLKDALGKGLIKNIRNTSKKIGVSAGVGGTAAIASLLFTSALPASAIGAGMTIGTFAYKRYRDRKDIEDRLNTYTNLKTAIDYVTGKTRDQLRIEKEKFEIRNKNRLAVHANLRGLILNVDSRFMSELDDALSTADLFDRQTKLDTLKTNIKADPRFPRFQAEAICEAIDTVANPKFERIRQIANAMLLDSYKGPDAVRKLFGDINSMKSVAIGRRLEINGSQYFIKTISSDKITFVDPLENSLAILSVDGNDIKFNALPKAGERDKKIDTVKVNLPKVITDTKQAADITTELDGAKAHPMKLADIMKKIVGLVNPKMKPAKFIENLFGVSDYSDFLSIEGLPNGKGQTMKDINKESLKVKLVITTKVNDNFTVKK